MALFGRRKRRERTVYFPWERRGVLGALQLPRRRARAWALIALAGLLLFWIYTREQRARATRITRASLERARVAVDAYRSDHGGRCPRDLGELTAPGDRPAYFASVPTDAWKRPLRYACPARDPSRPYDLLSDGPDGEPYGTDRIE
jgi:hypothetical protein